MRSIKLGRRAVIRHAGFLKLFGATGKGSLTAGDCASICEQVAPARAKGTGIVGRILQEGSLAERLFAASGSKPTRRRLRELFRRLAGSLAENRWFAV